MTRLPIARVESFGELLSTNDLLKSWIRSGVDVDGVVVRAVHQLSGRGRRERSWSSPPGGSWQSVAWRERVGGSGRSFRAQGVALAAALGAAEALRAQGAQVTLKWPNDLMFKERKLGGVLVETIGRYLVVGVGINVANPVPPGAAALRGWGVEVVSDRVLAGVRDALTAWLEAEDLSVRARTLDFLLGREVRVRAAQGVLEGRSVGVDGAGRLRLAVPDGAVVLVSAGTVEWYAAGSGGGASASR